jgi:hypothetical protein
MLKKTLPLVISLAAMLGLAACNAPADRSQADFNAAGQSLGNGNIAAGAQATGQAIGTGAQKAGDAINNTFNGNKSN